MRFSGAGRRRGGGAQDNEGDGGQQIGSDHGQVLVDVRTPGHRALGGGVGEAELVGVVVRLVQQDIFDILQEPFTELLVRQAQDHAEMVVELGRERAALLGQELILHACVGGVMESVELIQGLLPGVAESVTEYSIHALPPSFQEGR